MPFRPKCGIRDALGGHDPKTFANRQRAVCKRPRPPPLCRFWSCEQSSALFTGRREPTLRSRDAADPTPGHPEAVGSTTPRLAVKNPVLVRPEALARVLPSAPARPQLCQRGGPPGPHAAPDVDAAAGASSPRSGTGMRCRRASALPLANRRPVWKPDHLTPQRAGARGVVVEQVLRVALQAGVAVRVLLLLVDQRRLAREAGADGPVGRIALQPELGVVDVAACA